MASFGRLFGSRSSALRSSHSTDDFLRADHAAGSRLAVRTDHSSVLSTDIRSILHKSSPIHLAGAETSARCSLIRELCATKFPASIRRPLVVALFGAKPLRSSRELVNARSPSTPRP